MAPARIVLDTSCLITAVVFPNSTAGRIADLSLERQVVLLTSGSIEDEWATACFRPSVAKMLQRNRVTTQAYLNGVADIRMFSERVQVTGEPPPCRDERDRKFLHVARDGGAEFVVTTDDDLFAAPPLLGVEIVYPAQLLRQLAARGFEV